VSPFVWGRDIPIDVCMGLRKESEAELLHMGLRHSWHHGP